MFLGTFEDTKSGTT